MTNSLDQAQQQAQSLAMLDATLEAYGADASRWPMAARDRLSAFVASSGEAKRRLASARALDQVLAFAPKIGEARHTEIVDRIVARAERQPRTAAEGSQRVAPPHVNKWRANSYAGAALAASLALGILAGQNATIGTLATSAFSGSDNAGASGQQLAQSDEADGLLNEDLL